MREFLDRLFESDFAFSPATDIPLVTLTLAGFLWYFEHWARTANMESSVHLSSRLPQARARVIALFLCILLFFWMFNFAVWALYALLAAVGIVLSFPGGGEGGFTGFFLFGYFIREWAFGFPSVILQPPKHDSSPLFKVDDSGPLVGKIGETTTPLRPIGEAIIDGERLSLVSFHGGWIDSGLSIKVTNYQNGMPCVAPVDDADESQEANPSADETADDSSAGWRSFRPKA